MTKTSTSSWFDHSNLVDNVKEQEINTQVFGGKGTWNFQMIQNVLCKHVEEKQSEREQAQMLKTEDSKWRKMKVLCTILANVYFQLILNYRSYPQTLNLP